MSWLQRQVRRIVLEGNWLNIITFFFSSFSWGRCYLCPYTILIVVYFLFVTFFWTRDLFVWFFFVLEDFAREINYRYVKRPIWGLRRWIYSGKCSVLFRNGQLTGTQVQYLKWLIFAHFLLQSSHFCSKRVNLVSNGSFLFHKDAPMVETKLNSFQKHQFLVLNP